MTVSAPHPSTTVLRAQGLRRGFDAGGERLEVLRGVDLELSAGEVLAIVGPSGCGKSTLLQILGTLDRPDAGELEVCGLHPSRLADRELAALRNRQLGFVFQFHQLLPDFSALENIEMPGRIAGLEARGNRERSEGLLEQVGLASRRHALPGELSGGEQQRVAICRALVARPALVLADEPTGNLDPVNSERVLELLLELQAQCETALVLVTHDPSVASRCGRIEVLKDGSLVESVGAVGGSKAAD